MFEVVSIVLALLTVYALACLCLYAAQRRLIYYPVGSQPAFGATAVEIDNQGIRLRGWVLNPGQPRALIYFGGNAEPILDRRHYFEAQFSGFSVYLINYRGYGDSDGAPTEAGLFSDALAIYDELARGHDSISAYGRSLGSGVAVYLAAHRKLEKLILLTPYDSITSVAQRIYPMFPVHYLLKDRYDSAALAPAVTTPVLMVTAERDRVIPLRHSLALKRRFSKTRVEYAMVDSAAHDDVVEFPHYREAVAAYIRQS